MFQLWQTRRHWEKLARTDPLWAVLTHPDKAGQRWRIDDFFATGRDNVAADLAAVRILHPGLRRRHALDFGCGVGRLTQALAGNFDQVTGVDISTQMLAIAELHNRHGPRVAYVHNARPDLACFATGSFDFLYSLITLQHIPAQSALCYIGEFVRVLAPGGVALFQVPARSLETHRLSFYPPTVLKKLRRRLRHLFLLDPHMAMNAIPRETVTAILHAAGGRVLATVRADDTGASFESYRFVVTKP